MRPMPPPRKVSRPSKAPLPSVSLIGCGNWGTALALALVDAGFPLREIVVRKRRAADSRFATALGAHLAIWSTAALDADILWICTPDAAIAAAAAEIYRDLEASGRRTRPIVFHSSGALPSTELRPLHAIASVHPLMTFPRRARFDADRKCPLAAIPFAIEGDPRACRAASKLLRAMNAEPFALDVTNKPLYHAFGAFSSPLLIALLTAAMETAVAAGYTPGQARRRMRPIVERTVANFFADGPGKSFSGPIARGDAATIRRHLQDLAHHPRLQAVYVELARFALESLPAQQKPQILRLLTHPHE